MNALVLTDYKQLALQTRPAPAPSSARVLTSRIIVSFSLGLCLHRPHWARQQYAK